MAFFDFSYLIYLLHHNIGIIFNIFFLLFSSLIIRIILSITGHVWVRTQHQTITYLLLPIVAFIIASVIMNNIALSLGMIGALSIVRFRNPVKSPFELVMFFALLTLGIATTVDIKWTVTLLFVLCLIILCVHFYEKYLVLFGFKPFTLSFEEGLPLNFIEINSSIKINSLNENKSLINYVFSKDDNTYHYKLAFRNKRDLDYHYKKLDGLDEITSIDIRYSN